MMVTFLSLLSEIRNQIYKHCLCWHIIYPHSCSWQIAKTAFKTHPHLTHLREVNSDGPFITETNEESLNLTLLTVNHQVRNEALAIYLDYNIVTLSGNALSVSFFRTHTVEVSFSHSDLAAKGTNHHQANTMTNSRATSLKARTTASKATHCKNLNTTSGPLNM